MTKLEKSIARKGLVWLKILCLLLGVALTSAHLAMAKDHSSQQQTGRQTEQTEQQAPEPATPSVEYVRVKMGKSIFLDPPEDEEPGVYVRIRDTSGHEIDLQGRVVSLLVGNGFRRVPSLKGASYVLQANLRFAEEVSEAEMEKITESTYDQSVSEILKEVAASVAQHNEADADTNDRKQPEAGDIFGALLNIATVAEESQRKKRELEQKKATKFFSAVVDIEVRQQAKGDVTRSGTSTFTQETKLTENDSTVSGSNSSFSESDSTTETDKYNGKSKWVRYRVRIIASAKGRHVTLDDIKDPILRKLSSALGGMF